MSLLTSQAALPGYAMESVHYLGVQSLVRGRHLFGFFTRCPCRPRIQTLAYRLVRSSNRSTSGQAMANSTPAKLPCCKRVSLES